ncbi:sigma factor G inhibitor Gin [Thermoanaerobacterium sp. RBIITD]|uniref:sigma factor G inhibitor Gin n=1 Tax=Thermoanaerobacterium sp. RBIITD TaxID=1550240 RepID=UPI000BB6B655|nr:sigma factor G inhibitor Gin [Thermoanaerobacterium sp. RBIITD]SNX53849.1 Inhibitor of sigma-G Gin [Thermoanaerobacterium sp. RBIITD]
MESMVRTKRCFICNHETGDGIEVLGEFLCNDCQKIIVDISPGDFGYDFYRKKMIDIWQNYMKGIEYEDQI